MPLWGIVNNAANSDIAAVMQENRGVATANTIALFANTTVNAWVTGQTVGQFGIDRNSVAAMAFTQNTQIGVPTHSGWNLRTLGIGGRAGRVFYECLVASGTVGANTTSNDANVAPQFVIVITTQPASSNTARGNAVNLIVVANTQPVGGTLGYYWQVDGGPGSNTWANVANTGVYATANSNTNPTLSIANNFFLSGNNYRVVIQTAGALVKFSSNATVLNF